MAVVRKVKFPLEMKDGVKVTTIQDLRENFDMGQVIGYFLDGKLIQWLESRYYEDEAEAVASLDKEDTDIGKKLCQIFGVEYKEADIDVEEMAARNERITKLKQYTDDESIIENIDHVAFNQEELADLYDAGIQKIYLCEGKFSIPKSKQGLEYIVIGKTSVNGLKSKTKAKVKEEEKLSNNASPLLSEYELPVEIADKIEDSTYLVMEDYVVWASYGKLICFNKHTREEGTIQAPNLDSRSKMKAYDENIIIYKKYEKLMSLDISSGKNEVLCDDCEKYGGKFSLCKNTIVYNNRNGKLIAYDYSTKNKQALCLHGRKNQPIEASCFLLKDQSLYFVPYSDSNHKYCIEGLPEEKYNNENLYCYSMQTKTIKPIAQISPDRPYDEVIYEMSFYDGFLYIIIVKNSGFFMSPQITSVKTKKVNLQNYTVVELFSADINSNIIHSGLGSYRFPYISFVGNGYDYPAYVYNLKEESLLQIANRCGYTTREKKLFRKEDVFYHVNRCYTVENYFYYHKDHDGIYSGPRYRIDINAPKNEVQV